MKRTALGGLLLLLLMASRPVAAQETPPAPAATATVAEETATPSCADCHDQAKSFLTNPHARGAVTNGVVSNDACTTCHGDGTEHMQSGGDKTKIAVPRGRAGSDETCMLCHDTTTDRTSRHVGMHANSNQ